jgi:hypothetical protein
MIVTVVSGEPTTLDDGLIEATVGVGFDVDVDVDPEVKLEPDEAGISPPQPDRNPEKYSTDATNTNQGRIIGGFHHNQDLNYFSGRRAGLYLSLYFDCT